MHENDKSRGVNEDRRRRDAATMAPSCLLELGFEPVICDVSPLSLITQGGGAGSADRGALPSLRLTCADYIRHTPGALIHHSFLWGKQTVRSGAQCRH